LPSVWNGLALFIAGSALTAGLFVNNIRFAAASKGAFARDAAGLLCTGRIGE